MNKPLSKKSAAKKLEAMSRALDAMIERMVDIREDAGKDAEGLDVVYVADLLDRAFAFQSAIARRAESLTEVEAPKVAPRDVYEVLEEQNAESLRRMGM